MLCDPPSPPSSNAGFQMIIYIPPEFEAHLKIDKSRVHIIHMHGADLQTYFPYWDRLQAIRTSKLWKHQGDVAGWLAEAPQSKLPQYNPLVMSKFMLLRDAARLNPWGSRYHLWMDAGHLCAGGQHPDPAGTSMYRKHMASALFVSSWPYGTTTVVRGGRGGVGPGGGGSQISSVEGSRREPRRHASMGTPERLLRSRAACDDAAAPLPLQVHGLADRAMHIYMAQAEDPLRIVRGGIFGGTLPYIECALKAYIIALHQVRGEGEGGGRRGVEAYIVALQPQTLTDGYVGTEECIWAIIVKRFPHLFAPFDNNRCGARGRGGRGPRLCRGGAMAPSRPSLAAWATTATTARPSSRARWRSARSRRASSNCAWRRRPEEGV